jgi:hypothetical protein
VKTTGTRALERLLGKLLRGAAHASPSQQLEAGAERGSVRTLLRLSAMRLTPPRATYARASGPRLTPTLAGATLAAPVRAAARDLSQLVQLTRWALARGGYETAKELAAHVAPRLAELDAAERKAALSLISEIAIAHGEEAQAHALWQTHGLQPPARIRVRLCPETLQQTTLAEAWPECAAPDLYLASALATQGKLDAETAAQRIVERPLAWLQNPELDLLLQQLTRAPYDVQALSRYLRRFGLARCFRQRSQPSLLADLRFAPNLRGANGPRLSVLMAAKNASSTVVYAVDSVLRQSYGNFELLIADDASDDDTPRLLRERYAGDPRIHLFRSLRSQGPYNLRNALLSRAQGELVTFHDADDVSLPSRFARQVALLQKSGQVACVSSWLRIRSDGTPVFFADGHASRLSIVSLLATRAALHSVGPYPSARFGADLDIARRLAQRYGGLPRLREPLLLGLWSSQSLTRSQNAEAFESGYRAPSRRRYSELVFQRDALGADALPAALLERELAQMDNAIAPAPIEPL